jgi:N-acetyl-anhydromuramyl-L-alanine amidase AmpD
MIHLDGTLERLVANNEDSVVDPWEVTNGAEGYNSTSRHIVYVGGKAKDGAPRDTRTLAQMKALEIYVRYFHLKYPSAEIIGHHDLNPGKACPSFDVKAWLKTIGINQ